MPESYATTEVLRDGKPITVRALLPRDRDDLVAAAGRVSAKTLFRRFFGRSARFRSRNRYFTNIDFKRHVTLIAPETGRGREVIIGSGRYVLTEPTEAEVVLTVVDVHQGRGIGSTLLRHLAKIARDAGVKILVAEILPKHRMLKVFERSDIPTRKKHECGSVRIIMDLAGAAEAR